MGIGTWSEVVVGEGPQVAEVWLDGAERGLNWAASRWSWLGPLVEVGLARVWGRFELMQVDAHPKEAGLWKGKILETPQRARICLSWAAWVLPMDLWCHWTLVCL